MDVINISYFVQEDNGKKVLYVKVTDTNWGRASLAPMFGELAEGILNGTYTNICFDFSSLKLVTSIVFGVCMNIANLAKSKGKTIKFKFDKEAAETARMASLHSIAIIEEA
jgi:hypothetical protein